MRKTDLSESIYACFIYAYICENTSKTKPISRTKLISQLWNKYNLKIERKALSRHLNTLFISELGLVITEDNMIYYSEEEDMSILGMRNKGIFPYLQTI